MSEQLQHNLLESIGVVRTWIETTGDFVVEQAPIVVAEVIAWGLYSAVFWAIVCFAFALVAGITMLPFTKVMRGIHKIANDKAPIEFLWFLGNLALVGTSVSCVIRGLVCVHECIFISVAPRLYVLSELSDLIN